MVKYKSIIKTKMKVSVILFIPMWNMANEDTASGVNRRGV